MSITGLIGGTGLENLPADHPAETLRIETKFGEALVHRADWNGIPIAFLSRHGSTHGLAPHQINYRANILALSEMGVSRILATNAVGSLRLDLPPGSLVLVDDFIDFTRARPLTLWESADSVLHTDFTEPYCPELRAAVEESAAALDMDVLPRGVYLCTDGPRFETPAEVRLYSQWGADVVGMTGIPEAVFAREAGICYSALCIVTNHAAGLTREPVAHDAVAARMERLLPGVFRLLAGAAARIPPAPSCGCRVTD